MRKLLLTGVVAAALLLPSAPRAGVLTLGARTGVGLGLGDVAGTVSGGAVTMDEWVTAQIPFQFDLLFRVTPGFAIGGYLSLGVGIPGDVCDYAGAECTSLITRLGAQATYTFPAARAAPWIGAGFGYEWNNLDDGFDEATFSGFEYLNLQGGVDWKLGRVFSLGPFAMLSIGQYDDAELNGVSYPVANKKTHEWLTFGIRGKFDL